MKNICDTVQLLQLLVVGEGSYVISVLCIMHVSGSRLVNGLCGGVTMKPWTSMPLASRCLRKLVRSVQPALLNLPCSHPVLCDSINKPRLSLHALGAPFNTWHSCVQAASDGRDVCAVVHFCRIKRRRPW